MKCKKLSNTTTTRKTEATNGSNSRHSLNSVVTVAPFPSHPFLVGKDRKVSVTLAVPVTKNERYIEVIGGDDKIHVVDLEEKIDNDLLERMTRDPRNRYLLYTRSNPSSAQLLQINNIDSILSSNFNPNAPTVVVAHGWFSNQNTNLNPVIRDAYLESSEVNVIILDWSRIAMGSYLNAIANIPNVGKALGQFLKFLSETTGASLESMHLVGFSLGSHVVGNAGRELEGKVGRVTGLDPVSPIWHNNRNRLDKSDGIYVEIIHTNGRGSGTNLALGHADFYPNGGNSQPGCFTSICNHNRSWELFAATVKYNHLVGKECSSEDEVVSNKCGGKSYNMGNGDVSKSGSGLYRLSTTGSYPY
ncbi:Pancreatic lipase-related protein 2 [Papilio xuthus]|uniref:Pancreatic lipase-related protein 2 n=1 Tax=Papilio xuthus TaxID=66420 RepID=A0A194Q4L0_PAPXU|nr:Pancreatic lipase-related protein 2 [Papilio xuthus]